jgi:hypothetical protein
MIIDSVNENMQSIISPQDSSSVELDQRKRVNSHFRKAKLHMTSKNLKGKIGCFSNTFSQQSHV